MDHNPDRLCVWPGYFDMKQSRRSGRRVPKDASVLKPDLEGLFMAARAVGLRKIKREEKAVPVVSDVKVQGMIITPTPLQDNVEKNLNFTLLPHCIF